MATKLSPRILVQLVTIHDCATVSERYGGRSWSWVTFLPKNFVLIENW